MNTTGIDAASANDIASGMAASAFAAEQRRIRRTIRRTTITRSPTFQRSGAVGRSASITPGRTRRRRASVRSAGLSARSSDARAVLRDSARRRESRPALRLARDSDAARARLEYAAIGAGHDKHRFHLTHRVHSHAPTSRREKIPSKITAGRSLRRRACLVRPSSACPAVFLRPR